MQSSTPGKTPALSSDMLPGEAKGQSVALFAMIAACSAVFLTALDQTVVVTALPDIIDDLHIPLQQLDRAAWIISAYLLGYVIAMPLMGRISDLYGRRRVFVICLSIFGGASLVCGLATFLGNQVNISFLQHIGLNIAPPDEAGDPATLQPGLAWLIAARFVQAAGGGALIPVAMAVAGDYYGAGQRSLALGLIGMVTEAGGVLGPLYGAAIVQTFSWNVIFYLNLPLVIVLIGLIIWLVRPRPAVIQEIGTVERQPSGKSHIDLLGTLLLGASLVCLSLGLSQEAVTGTVNLTNSAPVQNNPLLIAAAIILFLLFAGVEIWVERRVVHQQARKILLPIIEPSLFRSLALSASSLVSLLVGAALIIAMADIPLFVATVQNGSALDSGLTLLRLTVMIPVGAVLGGWLCSRITCRLTAVAGLLLTVLGFWLMHLWPVNVDELHLTTSTLVCGFGFGLVIAPISTTAINAVRSSQMGMASSIVTVLRMIGMILGLAALTSWGLGRFYDIVRSAPPPPAGIDPLSPEYVTYQAHIAVLAAHEVYTSIFLMAGVLCLVAILPACWLEGRKASPYTVRRGSWKTMKQPR